MNYNPISDNLTQLEFIKIQRGVTTSYSTSEVNDLQIEDLTPTFPHMNRIGSNLSPEIVKVSGANNRIADSVKSGMINGDGNMIGEWCQHVEITGDNNAIASYSSGVVVMGDDNIIGGSNLTLINTYNKTINQSNSTYIQGRAVGGEASILLVTGTAKVITTTGDDDATIYLCDATDGNMTISLPDVADFPIGIPITFKKIDSTANTVTLDADGTSLIDGAGTLVIVTQYDAPRIVSDGANWWII